MKRREINQTNLLHSTDKILAAIVESTDDAIIAKNPDGTIIAWNPAAEKMYGYTSAEAIGQHISLIVPEEKQDELCHIMHQILAGKRIDHIETTRLAKDGRSLVVSLTVSPIKIDGEVIGASAIARDITHRKENERRLLLAHRRIERVNQILIDRELEVEDLRRKLSGHSSRRP